jgi:hypothetical protein
MDSKIRSQTHHLSSIPVIGEDLSQTFIEVLTDKIKEEFIKGNGTLDIEIKKIATFIGLAEIQYRRTVVSEYWHTWDEDFTKMFLIQKLGFCDSEYGIWLLIANDFSLDIQPILESNYNDEISLDEAATAIEGIY